MKRYILLFAAILSCEVALCQTKVITPLDQANTSGAYYNYTSIILSPGFSTLPGASFHAYILSAPAANCVPLLAAITQNQNYIVAYNPRVPFYGLEDLTLKNTCEVMQTVKYFDGLGRPLQTVQIKGSPNADKDLVQPFVYDDSGREIKKYLPYASISNDGSFKTNALTAGAGVFDYYNPVGGSNSQLSNGVARIATPFAESAYEASPLNRIIEQGSPGDAWQLSQGHTMKTAYLSNGVDEVRRYKAALNPGDPDYKRYLSPTGAYYANELFKTVSKDENWQASDGKAGTVEEFKDKEGKVVLKRTYNIKNGILETLSTMYVYDEYGNLCFVLTPQSDPDGVHISPSLPYVVSQANLDTLCYQYRYDGKNRLIEKKLPGKGWEYMVYNEFDQLVMSQDALQRSHNDQEWLVTKYDKFNRVVVTGVYKHTGSTADTDYRAIIQQNVDAAPPSPNSRWESYSGQGDGYTYSGNYNSFPFTLNTHLIINYYDTYSFPGASGLAAQGYASPMTKGLPTGTKTYTTDGMTAYLAVSYYDDEGRVREVVSQNHVEGTDRMVNTYSFTNELLSSTRTHIGYGKTISIANNYSYDHMGRKLQTTESVNSVTPVILSRLSYNEIGQLKNKELHSTNDGTSFLSKTTYSYNARGWLVGQASPLFNMTLKYEDNIVSQFNGNISKQEWGPAATPMLHNYAYLYDNLNRLKSGISEEGFNESLIYDKMGNISSLTRNPMGTNTYIYKGNQLKSISGLVNGDYGYDVNGNMITDGSKNISIAYNYLNLPESISKGGEQMQNTWLANGTKLKKTVGGLTREYAGGIEYNNGIVEFIQTVEGRARPNGSGYFYEYMLKDHLGNTRVMFDQNGTVLESSDYYPFGLQIARAGNTIPSPENRYKYNGKELQTELGLMQYDYGARFYDPIIGRWNVVDGKSELYFATSPYVYALNQPINAIDPDGHLVIFIAGQNGGNGWSRRYWQEFDTRGVRGEDSMERYLTKDFAGAVMNHFHDGRAMYIDGSKSGWSNTLKGVLLGANSIGGSNLFSDTRIRWGSEHKRVDIASMIKNLARDKNSGVITESIKVIAHSMGAAYAKGLIAEIVEYAKAHPKECAGLSISEYDFAAFQQNKLSAIPGAPLYQYDNKGDAVVAGSFGKMNGSHHAKEKGAAFHKINEEGGHSIMDFLDEVKGLPTGNYIFINGAFVKQE